MFARRKRSQSAAALGVCVWLALTSASVGASAQPGDVRTRADAAFNEGMKLAKDQQNEAALAKFELANATVPSAKALFQIARMERQLQQHALSIQHFRQVMKDEALPADARQESERAIEDLKTKVGVISVEAPPGAVVTVDLSPLDAKGSLEVVPGLHVVKARLGGELRSIDVTCAAGKASVVKIRFNEPASNDGGGTAHGDQNPNGNANGNQTPGTNPDKGSPVPLRYVVPIGLAVVGTAGVVLGGVFLSNANSSVDEARSLGVDSGCVGVTSPNCDRARSLQDDWKSQSTMSTVSFITGGVFLVAAGVSFFLWPKSSTTAKLTPLSPQHSSTLTTAFTF